MKPLFSKMGNNKVSPEGKMLAQKEETLAKRNGKLVFITNVPLSKLVINGALIDILSDFMNLISSKMSYNEVSTETNSTSTEIFFLPTLSVSPTSKCSLTPADIQVHEKYIMPKDISINITFHFQVFITVS